jgi:hypothetical protein
MKLGGRLFAARRGQRLKPAVAIVTIGSGRAAPRARAAGNAKDPNHPKHYRFLS